MNMPRYLAFAAIPAHLFLGSGCSPAAPAALESPGRLAPHAALAPDQGRPRMWKIPWEINYTDNGPEPANVADGISLYQPYIDQFSWQIFIALNWPAHADGTPDKERWIGAGGDAPTVWEHWMNADDVFRPEGRPPLAWGSQSPVPPECQIPPTDPSSPLSTVVFSIDDESWTTHNKPISVDSLFELTGRRSGPLVDQNGRWARFEVYLNQTAYDYVVKNVLYNRAGQKRFKDSGQKVDFPVGSQEVKAAWKILDKKSKLDEPKNFHRARGIFLKEDRTCEVVTVGLVAMHVSTKTQRTPARVWSTFENDLNLCQRRMTAVPATGDYVYPWVSGSFCDAACIIEPTRPGCSPPNQPPPKETWLPPRDPAGPSSTPHTQVVRVTPIPVPVGQLNSLVGGFLTGIDENSVFAKYDLIGSQWVMALDPDLNKSQLRQWLQHPEIPQAPQYTPRPPQAGQCSNFTGFTAACPGLILPSILASAVIETYVQPGASCLGCHQLARTTANQDADLTFSLERAMGPQ